MTQPLQRLRWSAYAAGIALLASMVFIRDPKADIRTVEVKRDGSFLFAGNKMDLNGIESSLVEAFQRNSKLAVAIRADSNNEYGAVMKVMTICQRNGIQKIGLSTKNE